jgi:hypothetical protein
MISRAIIQEVAEMSDVLPRVAKVEEREAMARDFPAASRLNSGQPAAAKAMAMAMATATERSRWNSSRSPRCRNLTSFSMKHPAQHPVWKT